MRRGVGGGEREAARRRTARRLRPACSDAVKQAVPVLLCARCWPRGVANSVVDGDGVVAKEHKSRHPVGKRPERVVDDGGGLRRRRLVPNTRLLAETRIPPILPHHKLLQPLAPRDRSEDRRRDRQEERHGRACEAAVPKSVVLQREASQSQRLGREAVAKESSRKCEATEHVGGAVPPSGRRPRLELSVKPPRHGSHLHSKADKGNPRWSCLWRYSHFVRHSKGCRE